MSFNIISWFSDITSFVYVKTVARYGTVCTAKPKLTIWILQYSALNLSLLFKKGFKIWAFLLDQCGNILADERLYLPFWIAIENNCLYKRKHLYDSTWLKLPSIFNIWGLSYDLLWWLWTVTASISHKFCFFILVDGLDCKY